MTVGYEVIQGRATAELAGPGEELLRLGRMITDLRTSISINVAEMFSVQRHVYPNSLSKLDFDVTAPNPDDLLKVTIASDALHFQGSTKAISRVGQSLINFFAPPVVEGAHFHLDSPEEGVLTDCGLIFTCRSY